MALFREGMSVYAKRRISRGKNEGEQGLYLIMKLY